jgi:predicted negative regulator of RcsB-dependent stress response
LHKRQGDLAQAQGDPARAKLAWTRALQETDDGAARKRLRHKLSA